MLATQGLLDRGKANELSPRRDAGLIGNVDENSRERKSRHAMLPIVFGILTAICFAIASLLAQRGYHAGPAPWGAWITIAANTVFLVSGHWLAEGHGRLFVLDNLVFVAVGLFVPGVTRVLSFRGIRTLGSSITATIVNTTPMFSMLLAITLLGERPTALVGLGVLLTVAGLVTASWGTKKTSYPKNELIFPLLCALLFSLKDITVRWGLGGAGAQPILAAAIAAATSTVEIFVVIRFFQGEKFAMPPLRVSRWFVSSGMFTGASFLFMFVAFSMERVSIVAPLVNSYTVFVSLLAPLMAREIERVTARKFAGAALVVAGIFAVALGKD